MCRDLVSVGWVMLEKKKEEEMEEEEVEGGEAEECPRVLEWD